VTQQCQPGEMWNGAMCQTDMAQCATFSSRGELLTTEARGIRPEMEAACRKDPFGQECRELQQRHEGAVLRYRMLLNEAPAACRTTLADPISL